MPKDALLGPDTQALGFAASTKIVWTRGEEERIELPGVPDVVGDAGAIERAIEQAALENTDRPWAGAIFVADRPVAYCAVHHYDRAGLMRLDWVRLPRRRS